MCDFRVTQINAKKNVFPQTNIDCWFFHYSQAILVILKNMNYVKKVHIKIILNYYSISSIYGLLKRKKLKVHLLKKNIKILNTINFLITLKGIN